MAESAVRYSRYPMEGLRGCAPERPATVWGVSSSEYLEIANDEILVTVQIETKEAIEKIEEIVSVEGIDAALIGPLDLSASMGVRGQVFHPKVIKAMKKTVDACLDAGIAPGIFAGMAVDKFGVEYVSNLIEQGFRFITVTDDMTVLNLGCNEFLKRALRQCKC
jgi:2-keto-3-deoxy-L-rhamnonate aldolase RhmA